MTKTNPSRKGASAPVSVRFSAEEKLQLKKAAKNKPLSVFIRNCLFDDGETAQYSPKHIILQEKQKLLAQLLFQLGKSEINSSLSGLIAMIENGSIGLDSDIIAKICKACDEISEIRLILLKALGLRLRDKS